MYRSSQVLAAAAALLLAAAPAAAQTSPTMPASPGASPAPPSSPPATSTSAPAVPAGPLRLTLSEAIALALRQQPTIRSAEQSQVAAAARIPQARAGYYPKVDVNAAMGNAQTFSTSSNDTIRGDSTSIIVQGRQLIWDFGKTRALVDDASANLRVSEGETDRVRDLVVQNVRTAYFGLLQARRLVAVADAALSRADLNLRSARGFFDVGTKPKSDVTRAEVEVANARVNVIRARNNVRLAETTLANALGLEATRAIEIDDVLVNEPFSADPGALLTEALANRPELRQAQARVDQSRAQLSGARAGYWPDFFAQGTYGTSSGDAIIGVDGTAAPSFGEVWSISLNLSWNVFQGWFTTNRVKETEALVQSARSNAEALELQVRLDVEQAYISVIEASERILATEKAVESARENLRLSQGRYDAGVGTILDLTEAQLSLTNAEADEVRALTDFRVGLAILDRVVARR